MYYKKRIERIVDYSIEYDTFNKARMVSNKKNVCVFGLGTFFREAFESKNVKEKYHVNLLSDNDKSMWGRIEQGIPVVNPKKLRGIEDLIVIIMVGNPVPIERQLNELGILWVTYEDLTIDDELGFTKELEKFEGGRSLIVDSIDCFEDERSKEIYVECLANRIAYPMSTKAYAELYSEPSYFGVDILPLTNEEIYVDCGAFDGDTIARFTREVSTYDHVYGFELEYNNYQKCVSKFGNNPRITLINKGVWDQNKEIEYSSGDGDNEPLDGTSILKADVWTKKCIAEVVCIDDELEGVPISYIKMDIEGSELNALKGAKKTIIQNKPKLAISVYHKTSDFWEIPQYIKQLNKEYRLYLRHHKRTSSLETVLYAV